MDASNNMICVIGVYYGKFNNYFDLWLKSCQYNHKIDFLIFTDQHYSKIVPNNVKFINIPFKEVKSRAENVLKMKVSLERPYKLCDYKPIFGQIFADFISDYEYWGHCDFDLIFGDILSFMERYEYRRYDKFLPLGHLAFYKNTDAVNRYFTLDGSRCGGYKTVFTSDASFAFDENYGINSIMQKHNLPIFTKRVFADITPIYKRFRISEFCAMDNKYAKNYKYQVFYWNNGKIFRVYENNGMLYKEEFMYAHFRSRPNFTVEFNENNVQAFLITQNGFIPFVGDVDKDNIRRNNPYPGRLVELFELSKFKFAKYWRSAKRRLLVK